MNSDSFEKIAKIAEKSLAIARMYGKQIRKEDEGMKTWEMIIKLEENPQKEFIRTRDGLVIRTDEKGYLRWAEGHNWLNLTDEWEEVKKPVTFMEAFQAFRKMKTISVKCDGMEDAVFLGESNGHAMFHEEYIEHGKWYIE